MAGFRISDRSPQKRFERHLAILYPMGYTRGVIEIRQTEVYA
jgi:hypothetical protein